MIIAGIDPGFSGAIALFNDADLLGVYSVPILQNPKNEIDEEALVELFESIDHAFVEKAQVMPNQGISSAGRYMMSFGIMRGILAAMKIPYTLVTPQRWKKAVVKDMPKGKDSSLILAKRLFPSIKIGQNHNKAEAILIGLYGTKELLK
jgi:crossover junction endodeoxyribonuclease RuvC